MKRIILLAAVLVGLSASASAQELSVLAFQPDYRPGGGTIFRVETSGNSLQQCIGAVAMLNNNFPPGMWAECAARDDLEGRWVPVPGPSWQGEAAAKAASRRVQVPVYGTAQ